ncbi:MAG: CpsD/CapB family tyrosine-protein kinase [Thermodesulfobacteriota bacterium]
MGKIYKALEKNRSESLGLHSDNEDNPAAETLQEAHGIKTDRVNTDRVETDGVETSAEPDYDAVPENIDPTLVALAAPRSLEAEQFRLLRNNILFPESGRPPRSIMVTSPSPEEGKSFVAANLAVSIAQSIDEYVLLMDCDLRKSTLHELFKLHVDYGLSDYLSSGRTLSSVLKKTYIDKLTILPGGKIPHNPSELLSSEQMRRLLNEVKQRYSDRYIIIDTPPPYITSEGNALVRNVDGIILVVRNGKTRKKDVEDVIQIYGKEKILGVVYNFAEKSPGYGYGYQKYGYGYGK